jgi:hypothetical protein
MKETQIKKLKLLSILIVILFSGTKSSNPSPTEQYPYSGTLESPDLYYVYWKHDDFNITFEIHYKNTSKWILFGIQSENHTDLIAGWVNDDGTGHFSDRKLSKQNELTVDSNQDWTILDAFSKEDYKIMVFTRKIKQFCGSHSKEDLDIQIGGNQVVYASGKQVDLNDGLLLDFETVKLSRELVLLNTNGPFLCVKKPSSQVFTSTPTGIYTKYIDLMDDGFFRFYWNFTSTDLIGEIHVRTTGWVGFGLSPNGGMDKSDVFIGWIDDNGTSNFTVGYFFFGGYI